MASINSSNVTTNITSHVTTYDVARLAKVSIGTVSRVLSNQTNVDDSLRARVLEVIKEIGYVHVPRKRRGSEESEPTEVKPMLESIMFCVPIRQTPALQEAYYYQVLHGVESECNSRNISLTYSVLEDNPRSLAQIKSAMLRGSANGLVMVTYSSQELIEGVLGLQVPLVLIDPQQPTGLKADIVMSDYFGGTLLAMQHLLKLGHTKIALVNGPKRYGTERRLQAYRVALAEAELPYQAELVAVEAQTPEGGFKASQELLGRGVDFSAVCCANDNMGCGVIQALEKIGRSVPDDVSVIGFDDHGVAALSSPPLTTLHAGTESKGKIAIRQMLERLQQPEQIEPSIWSIIPLYLVNRSSTAPAI